MAVWEEAGSAVSDMKVFISPTGGKEVEHFVTGMQRVLDDVAWSTRPLDLDIYCGEDA